MNIMQILYFIILLKFSNSLINKIGPNNSFDNEETAQILPNIINQTHFSCDNNTKILPLNKLNDDICDCLDNSDENLTNACPYGKFKCPNKLYYQKIISTSKVNDGFCDCCDGSDEPSNNCIKTCYSLSKYELSKIEKDYETLKKVISAYDPDKNKEYFSYHMSLVKNITNWYKSKIYLFKNKMLIVSYLRHLENSFTDKTFKKDYVDSNGIGLNDLYDVVYKLNDEIKEIDDNLSDNKLVIENYIKYGIFKDLLNECLDLKCGNYMCTLCNKNFRCASKTKSDKKNYGNLINFDYANNTAYFEGSEICYNYGIKMSASIKFDCGMNDELKLIKKENECYYKFIFFTKMGCNYYKLQSLFNKINSIIDH